MPDGWAGPDGGHDATIDGGVDARARAEAGNEAGAADRDWTIGTDYWGQGAGRSVCRDAGSYTNGVAMADMDLDGHLDLLFTNEPEITLALLFGDGAGGLAAPTHYATRYEPVGIATGRLDQDSWPDVAVANWGGGGLWAYLGTGSGALAAGVHANGSLTVDLVIADLDGDGRQDLASVGEANRVSISFGDGNGGFSPDFDEVFDTNLYDIAVADLDGDHDLDLAVVDGSDTITVLLGDGTGTSWSRHALAQPDCPIAVAAADLDGDAVADLAVASMCAAAATILLGDGSGANFVPHTMSLAGLAVDIAVADIERDGDQDLVFVTGDAGRVTVLYGTGDGTFPRGIELALAPEVWSDDLFHDHVAVGDLDEDGVQDIVVACHSRSEAVIFRSGR